MKINYKNKSRIIGLTFLGCDLLQFYKDLQYSKYCYSNYISSLDVFTFYNAKYFFEPAFRNVFKYHSLYYIDDVYFLEELFSKKYKRIYKELIKICKANYNRKTRLNSRIDKLINSFDNPLFLTLTFTNDVLNSTSADTRKKYVKNFLKSITDYYIANIDFGAKNGREHYHAIIGVNSNIDYLSYSYGRIDGIKIIKNGSNIPLATYISKLTNHAIKKTTRRNAVIYSRKMSVFDNLEYSF